MDEMLKILKNDGFEEALWYAFDLEEAQNCVDAAKCLKYLLDYADSREGCLDEYYDKELKDSLFQCQRIAGDIKGALETADRRIRERGETAELLLDKAEILTKLMRQDEALPLREKAINTAREKYGENSRETANAIKCAAISLTRLGKLREAEESFKEALRIMYECGAPDYDIARALQEMGRLYSDKVRFGKAVVYFNDALNLLKSSGKAPDDIDVLSLKNDIADAYKHLGNLRAAVNIYEEQLEICTEKFGEKSFNTLVATGNLASAYRIQGDPERAEKLRRKALEGFFEMGGEESCDYVRELLNLADDEEALKRYDSAISLTKQAYELRKKYLGEHHELTVDAMRILGGYYADIYDYDAALSCFESVVAEIKPGKPNDFFDLLAKLELARCRINRLENDRAEEILADVGEQLNGLVCDNLYIDCLLYSARARLAINVGDFSSAAEYAKKAVDTAAEDKTNDDDDIRSAKTNFADALFECERFKDAERQYMNILNSLSDEESNSDKMRYIFCRLAQIKAKLGETDEALFFIGRAEECFGENADKTEEYELRFAQAAVAKHTGNAEKFGKYIARAKELADDFHGYKRLLKRLGELCGDI